LARYPEIQSSSRFRNLNPKRCGIPDGGHRLRYPVGNDSLLP
jgi:hypothetical protein